MAKNAYFDNKGDEDVVGHGNGDAEVGIDDALMSGQISG